MNNKDLKMTKYEEFAKVFKEENSIHNLISKNDEKFLYEKHYFDSLGIKLFFDKYGIKSGNILDIGCGGGFPSVPIAIEHPEFLVTAVDSIQKKINSVSSIREKLGLKNLTPICTRAENIKCGPFDIVVSRAVADLSKISEYALPLVKKSGWFIVYKSKKADEEISRAKTILTKHNAEIIDIIEYHLPLEEIYDRKLICIKKS